MRRGYVFSLYERHEDVLVSGIFWQGERLDDEAVRILAVGDGSGKGFKCEKCKRITFYQSTKKELIFPTCLTCHEKLNKGIIYPLIEQKYYLPFWRCISLWWQGEVEKEIRIILEGEKTKANYQYTKLNKAGKLLDHFLPIPIPFFRYITTPNQNNQVSKTREVQAARGFHCGTCKITTIQYTGESENQ